MTGREEILRTSRLRLTTWLPEDLDDLAALHADREVMQHMTSGPQTREATRERLERFIAEHRTRGWSKWRIEGAPGFLGRAGFGLAHRSGHREVGYLLARAAWGAGLATELTRALRQWHDDHPEPALAPGLRAYVLPGNAASCRVLEKAGFRAVGEEDGQLVFESG
ncbi:MULTISPECIES: GNAT family N-acetyltransferase [Amycolatopsis]|uniref:Protein N-acetyltransferase, RimJ/RimL family n=1 Tax=Amycolatopsis rubida TaxID=112413 RepID=A0A1I5ZRR2_9PSEU|nr:MULTISPECIES: GNAT family N-acetyltransferase [Amycolatopsis]OAP24047.1 anhydro-N-acetylmuramic acid kinase [Amycolatopsis sp. M39]SFQ59100.1 Protein N-acetyltransferase, RimJ/RimL family [Amycolatopsis rubida]